MLRRVFCSATLSQSAYHGCMAAYPLWSWVDCFYHRVLVCTPACVPYGLLSAYLSTGKEEQHSCSSPCSTEGFTHLHTYLPCPCYPSLLFHGLRQACGMEGLSRGARCERDEAGRRDHRRLVQNDPGGHRSAVVHSSEDPRWCFAQAA